MNLLCVVLFFHSLSKLLQLLNLIVYSTHFIIRIFVYYNIKNTIES